MALVIDYTPTKTGKAFMLSDAKMRVIMGPVGCLAGDTLVVTEFGPLPISSIDHPMRVLSWNEKTCRFQLSWCGGSFPKGKDYLYRVSTQQGEFAASAHHQMLDADHNYRRAESSSPGQSLLLCSDIQQVSTLADAKVSLTDEPDSIQNAVNYLASYAKLARLRGQQLLLEEDTDQGSSQEYSDAHISASYYASSYFLRKDDLAAQLQAHIRQDQPYDRTQTDGYRPQVEPPLCGVGGSFSVGFSERIEEKHQQAQQSGLMCEPHPPNELYTACSDSYFTSTTNGTIKHISKENAKRVYWDMQVLDTNNYVTVDGAIHHNSGKSVLCCFEILRRASQQAPGKDGFRRTRWAVVRETVRQLSDTTIKTWLDWFPDGVCGRFMRTTKTYFLEIGDVRAEIMFRALDDADDVANLNSLELTGAWFNECRDIAPEIVDAMSKRIGRYPSKKDGGPTYHGMWADTNPPTMDTWWYHQMEHLDHKDGVSPNDNGWDVFKQPSGRSQEAENLENLPDDYYDIQGRSDEYIRTFIDGEYGHSLAGQPVYKYFRPDYHTAKSPLIPIKNGVRPIVVGMDLGLTPAAAIGQQDPRGRMLVLAEAVSFDMGVQRFSRTVLKPLINEKFPGQPILVVVDPSGVQRAQTDERSAVDILKAEGFKVIPARTNNISARLNAVDEFLMRQVDGDAAFQLDPRCTHLKAAMMGGYRYKEKQQIIDKNKHSHIAEALQYLSLHIAGIGEFNTRHSKREVKHVSAKGWT